MKTFILAGLLALTAVSGFNPTAAGSLPASIGGAVGQAAGSVGSAVGTIFSGGTHAATPVQAPVRIGGPLNLNTTSPALRIR
jgi:hypothetical protein